MTFFVSLPLFLIILAGWLFRKLKIADASWIHILNIFAYYVSLPALVIASLWKINLLDASLQKHFIFAFINLLIFSLMTFLILSVIKLKTDLKATLFLTIITGNTIYMGFPLVELGYGKEHLSAAAIIGTLYLAAPILISILVIRYWHAKHHNLSGEIFEFAKNPLVVSIIVGILLSLIKSDSRILEAIQKAITMLGQTASPVALFVLGSFLYGRFQTKNIGAILSISAVKMILFPLITVLTALFIFQAPDIKVPLLLSSMPVAVTTFIIGERFKLDIVIIGSAILASTVFSLLIIPVILAIFN